jgi:hypothetical protein
MVLLLVLRVGGDVYYLAIRRANTKDATAFLRYL